MSSPDYSLLLASYLKAKDTFRVAEKNYDRAKDLYSTTPSPSATCCKPNPIAIQAQADLNAAEQGMKILGIPNPEN